MKKGIRKIIKFSTLITMIIFSVSCVITTALLKKPKDYSNLKEYTSTLSLNDEVQICNLNELYIKDFGGGYHYANIYSYEDAVPIFTYQGMRLNFQFDSEVIEYNENAPAKCRIISRDSRITGTFEFELRPEKLAERGRDERFYSGYLICGVLISLLLAVPKALVAISLQSEDDSFLQKESEKDLLYAIKKYDFSKAENAEIKLHVTKKTAKFGYSSVDEFIKKKANEKRLQRRKLFEVAVAEYLIFSGCVCGITALIVSIFTMNFTSGFNVWWLVSIPIIAAGYLLKRKLVYKSKKAKGTK